MTSLEMYIIIEICFKDKVVCLDANPYIHVCCYCTKMDGFTIFVANSKLQLIFLNFSVYSFEYYFISLFLIVLNQI